VNNESADILRMLNSKFNPSLYCCLTLCVTVQVLWDKETKSIVNNETLISCA